MFDIEHCAGLRCLWFGFAPINLMLSASTPPLLQARTTPGHIPSLSCFWALSRSKYSWISLLMKKTFPALSRLHPPSAVYLCSCIPARFLAANSHLPYVQMLTTSLQPAPCIVAVPFLWGPSSDRSPHPPANGVPRFYHAPSSPFSSPPTFLSLNFHVRHHNHSFVTILTSLQSLTFPCNFFAQ